MGDGADFALERAMDEWEHYQKYKDADLNTQYDEGLIDEYGGTIGNVEMFPKDRKPSGPGDCPICKNETKLKDGKFGSFYGCVNFPKCKGSRNI